MSANRDKIKGHNEFYEGWIARVFDEPSNPSRSPAWQDGWQMADETSELHRLAAFAEEIILGKNVIIEGVTK